MTPEELQCHRTAMRLLDPHAEQSTLRIRVLAAVPRGRFRHPKRTLDTHRQPAQPTLRLRIQATTINASRIPTTLRIYERNLVTANPHTTPEIANRCSCRLGWRTHGELHRPSKSLDRSRVGYCVLHPSAALLRTQQGPNRRALHKELLRDPEAPWKSERGFLGCDGEGTYWMGPGTGRRTDAPPPLPPNPRALSGLIGARW